MYPLNWHQASQPNPHCVNLTGATWVTKPEGRVTVYKTGVYFLAAELTSCPCLCGCDLWPNTLCTKPWPAFLQCGEATGGSVFRQTGLLFWNWGWITDFRLFPPQLKSAHKRTRRRTGWEKEQKQKTKWAWMRNMCGVNTWVWSCKPVHSRAEHWYCPKSQARWLLRLSGRENWK